MKGTLYLIPNSLGSNDPSSFLAEGIIAKTTQLSCFIVEDLRNARRYLKLLDREINIDKITFFELNKHTSVGDIPAFLEPALRGVDTGVLSEAGLPGIADPGATVVGLAHERGLTVKPLTGPSSLFLTLMASGLNGQSFTFHGYLPIQSRERIQALKKIEQQVEREGSAHLFIEAPYRNNGLLEDILKSCSAKTLLTIGTDLTTDQESVMTKSIDGWKKRTPDLHKRPSVFILGR